jgi:hypothetical protein
MTKGTREITMINSSSYFARFSRVFLASAAILSAQTAIPVQSAHIVSYDFNGQRVPKWNGAALTAIENNTVHSFAPDGRELPPAVLSIPGAARVMVNDAAATADGALVVCGWASDLSGRQTGFLGFIPPDRSTARIVQTVPYIAWMVAAEPDGTVWTRGLDMRTKTRPKDSTIIRHFDASGRLLEGFIPLSSLSPDEAASVGTGVGAFAASAGRVGSYLQRGKRYSEIVDGVVHDYPGLPLGEREYIADLAILESGDVMVSKGNMGGGGYERYFLDRSTGTWQRASFPEGAGGERERLAGQNGDQLVFQAPDLRTLHLVAVTR